jgi:SAM-dependent methyltransferase
MAARKNIYRVEWDRYAANWRESLAEMRPDLVASKDAWPGDEWGNEGVWRKVFKSMFEDYGVANWKHCVEIGPGSGKYTDLVLKASTADVLAFDVSKKFLEVLRSRMKWAVEDKRLYPVLLLGKDSSEMFAEIDRRGLVGKIDAVYSIDAMVHVDFQYVMAYLVTAALVLKHGGNIMMTLANALSEWGFEELLSSTSYYYDQQGLPSPKFEWVSVDLIRGVLERLGFTVDFVFPEGGDHATQRDIYVVARLSDVPASETLRSAIGLTS